MARRPSITREFKSLARSVERLKTACTPCKHARKAAAKVAKPRKRKTTPPPLPASDELGARVLRVAKSLGGGSGKRVMLSKLRAMLPGVPRATLDQELRALQLRGHLVLMALDNPIEVTPAVEAGALRIGNVSRHLLYLS